MGWIGVDFDGTMFHYGDDFSAPIGPPIKAMIDRVKRWRAEGREVRVFTARCFDLDGNTVPDQVALVEAACLEHIGEVLPITNRKDFAMLELYDDRAVQVEMNTGRLVGYSTRGLDLVHMTEQELLDGLKELL